MPISPYRASTDAFNPLFDSLFGSLTQGPRMASMLRAPEADVVETENEIRVTAELPGMRAEDVSVDLENNVLTISGEKQQERSEGKEGTWHLSERRYGKFSRSFVLPRDVDADRIAAHFDNGVLTLTVPKSERARRRRISIENATGNGNGASPGQDLGDR